MRKTLIKDCQGCGLGYYKPWYEPTWLARKNWVEAHKTYHGNSQRDYGRDLECERIIKLLDKSLIYGEPVVIQRDQLIALIKGEQK